MTPTAHPDLPPPDAPAGDWLNRRLGVRTVTWRERDPILFALAVGARPDELDLIFEDRLRVLPTFALTLAQWAPDLLGEAGAFDSAIALHGAQHLEVYSSLPPTGELTMTARVSAVWDKGSAAVFDITVECDQLSATWSIFAPGRGGFGGERGPGRPASPIDRPTGSFNLPLADNAAALYRLLGDRHRIHIDPAAAALIGQQRPVLHGLATLASAALALARASGAHPADLVELTGRFAGPVLPGETVRVEYRPDARFEVHTDRGPAITAGSARYC